jgi:hypothetical protein
MTFVECSVAAAAPPSTVVLTFAAPPSTDVPSN